MSVQIAGTIHFYELHSRKLTWNLKMMVSNRNLLFQVSIFGCHVSFRECSCLFVEPSDGNQTAVD